MEKTHNDIIVFTIVVTLIIILLGVYIIGMLYLYIKKQEKISKRFDTLKIEHEKAILSAQLEMQEETFRHISREIHDNINLSLTLAKLNLNTLNINEVDRADLKIKNSIELISQSILELSDISQSLNADFIIKNGLLKALQDEISRIIQIDLFEISIEIDGTPIYMDSHKELLIFRMIQESIKNIIKHSGAKQVKLILNYQETSLEIIIKDDGVGFDPEKKTERKEAGLNNIKTRLKLLNGCLKIHSKPNKGTSINLSIPN